jgi:cell division protease FtsH
LSSTARQIIFWLLIIAGALLLYKLVNPNSKNSQSIDLAILYQKIEAGEIKQLTIKQNETVAVDTRSQELRANLTNEQQKNELMKKALEPVTGTTKSRVEKVEDESGSSSYLWPMLITWAPLLFIIGIWVFMLRQMQSGGNKALSFGRSRAKLLNNQQKRVTFKDVAGVEEAKEELQEIIEFLKEPQKFQLGGAQAC